LNTEERNEPLSVQGERLIGLPVVINLLGVCARTVRRMVDRGEFPKPVKVAGCVRFFQSDVAAYLNRLKEQQT
jgi:predicted DNA-binding transcriptional regulator AlpA